MSKTIFRELLDKEASPALGCTEPMMFALGGAITRKHAPGKVLRVDMVGCGLMVTGVQAVGIPKTGGKTGAFLASAVGIINGDGLILAGRCCTTSPPKDVRPPKNW